MKKITVLTIQKGGDAVKPLEIAGRQGGVLQAVPGTLYKVMVDGVQMTPKNATFLKKKGHLLIEQDGELIVDLDYGTAFANQPVALRFTDDWSYDWSYLDAASGATPVATPVAMAPQALTGPEPGADSTSAVAASGPSSTSLALGGMALLAAGGTFLILNNDEDDQWPQSTPASTASTASGDVTAGPILAGNGLKALAYDKDGNILGESVLAADGTFTLTVTNGYRGPVLIKVVDSDNGPDYRDEATGAAQDLTVDLRALATVDGTGTIHAHLSPLTELAVRELGIEGDRLGTLQESDILAANKAIAQLFGLGDQDLSGLAPQAVIAADGSINASANPYGLVLALLSGMDANGNMEQTLATLAAAIDKSGSGLSWNEGLLAAIHDQLMAAAATVAATTGCSAVDLVAAIAQTSLVSGDTTAPTALSAVVTGHDSLGASEVSTLVVGDHLQITLTMSEAVVVDGQPTLTLDFDGQLRQATYVSGSGSSSLIFEYTIADGDHDSLGGVTVGALSLPTGAQIVDIASHQAHTDTVPATAANAVVIDAEVPAEPTLAIDSDGALELVIGDVLDGAGPDLFACGNGWIEAATTENHTPETCNAAGFIHDQMLIDTALTGTGVLG